MDRYRYKTLVDLNATIFVETLVKQVFEKIKVCEGHVTLQSIMIYHVFFLA